MRAAGKAIYIAVSRPTGGLQDGDRARLEIAFPRGLDPSDRLRRDLGRLLDIGMLVEAASGLNLTLGALV
jgi:hypothetical protein